jgi:hypothetical protein
MLRLGPDKVASGVNHDSIGAGIDAGRYRATQRLAARHQLDFGRVPFLAPGRGVKALAYFQVFMLNGP